MGQWIFFVLGSRVILYGVHAGLTAVPVRAEKAICRKKCGRAAWADNSGHGSVGHSFNRCGRDLDPNCGHFLFGKLPPHREIHSAIGKRVLE